MYYIYFIREFFLKANGKNQKGFVKIGVAKDIGSRIKALETGNARDFEILATIEYKSKTQAFFEEKRLHHTFRKIHIKREWFKNKIDFGRVKALYPDILFVHKDCFYKRQNKNKAEPIVELTGKEKRISWHTTYAIHSENMRHMADILSK